MYEQETGGFIVRVVPNYLEHESKPLERRFLWSYDIEIENRSTGTAQLMTRYWRITDENGITQEVRGAGVIGQQPVIKPGQRYAYASMCPLPTPRGVMVGSYTMRDLATEAEFDIAVPAFALESPHAGGRAN
jgi:ApaG protein